MTERMAGKVAVVTGAARGQGRSHALRLASEGADIIAIDICRQIDTAPFEMPGPEDLLETERLVKDEGRRVVAIRADVRDYDALSDAVKEGVAQLGRLDTVVANAGIFGVGPIDGFTEQQFRDVIDVNLIGMWHTIKATVGAIRAGGNGGSIILCSSTAGLHAIPYSGHYVTAKHGVQGLMRTAATELAPDSIRVNTVNPSAVDTPMIMNDATYAMMAPHLAPEQRTREAIAAVYQTLNKMPVPWLEPVDVSNAVLWLASDESRYVTGTELKVDAGEAL